MAPTLIVIAKVALIAVFFAAMATGMWANSRMMRRMKEARYRYWMINPMSVFAAWKGIEFPIFIAAVFVLASAVKGFIALG
jgi:hypothetical protein